MKNISRFCLMSIVIILLNACGVSGTRGGGINNNSGASGPSPITIDNAGVVPVMGQTSTISVIYVHNNTNQTIQNISYAAKLNTDDNSSGNSSKILKLKQAALGFIIDSSNFLNPSSVADCATITAGHSCALAFNTPIIDNLTAQGSALITARYRYLNKDYTFNQVISYGIIDNESEQGALFNSSVIVQGFGNSIGYATSYLYGSGAGKIYTVTGISTNRPSAVITQGNITGMSIQSNYVQAVEVGLPLGNSTSSNSSGFSVILNATSVSLPGGASFSDSSNSGVVLNFNGAFLSAGLVPIINAAGANPTGSLYVANLGNAVANLGSIVYPSGVTPFSETDSCGSSLSPGFSCVLHFRVPLSNGVGNIVIPYTGGPYTPLVKTITWYDNNSILLQMSLSSNPLLFSAISGGIVNVTTTNIGNRDLSNVTIPAPVVLNGNATVIPNSLSCSSGTNSLPIGKSCTYSVSVSNSMIDYGTIKFLLSGDESSQTYTSSVAMNYISYANYPLLTVFPPVNFMTITGNNVESVTKTLTITNNGGATAIISAESLSNNPVYMSIKNTTCGVSLSPNESCSVVIQLGPYSSALYESGNAMYNVFYSAGGPINMESAQAIINYTLQSSNSNLALQSVTPTNISGGSGELLSPYIFEGDSVNTKSIVLTYVNTGIDPVKITGVSNSNSPIAWEIALSSTCVNTVLNPNATCNIIFNNVLSANILAGSSGIGANYEINLTLPSLVFTDNESSGAQFFARLPLPESQFPNSGVVLYVNSHQATIANIATESLGVVTVQNVLANALGYSPVTVTSKFESYYQGTPITSSGCTQSANLGNVTQECVLTPDGLGNATEYVEYTINPTFIGNTLNVLYSIQPNSQTVSMSPIAQKLMLQ